MDYGMFTDEGNLAVHKIVTYANGLHEVNEGPVERVWNWALNELEALARDSRYEEATDTAVREAVYDRVVCG